MDHSVSRWKLRKWLGAIAVAVPVAVFSVWLALAFEGQSVVGRKRLEVGFILGLEAAYLGLFVISVIGLPLLIVRVLKGRKMGRRRPGSARLALLCGALLFSFLMCEVTAAVFKRLRATTVVANRPASTDVVAFELSEKLDPLPRDFPDAKTSRDFEILLVGESSACGIPYHDWFSVGSLIAEELQPIFPEREFRVAQVATSGHTIRMQRKEIVSRVTRRPDLLLIYCGHNEFSARFGWDRDRSDHYVDAPPPSFFERVRRLIEGVSPTCGLLRLQEERSRVAIPPPEGGFRELVDVPVYTKEQYDELLADFRARLDELVVYGKSIGAMVLLVMPPGNDSGYEPNRSFLPPEWLGVERAKFAEEIVEARRLEEKSPEESMRRYEQSIKRAPQFAEAHYRLARLFERAEKFEDAYQHDVKARDCDGLPFRCLTAFQEVYREVAKKHDVMLVDTQNGLRAKGRHALLDEALFQDAMHPSLRGFAGIAELTLAELKAKKVLGWPEDRPAPKVDAAKLAARYKLDSGAWAKVADWEIMFWTKTMPVRYERKMRRARQEDCARAVVKLRAGADAESVGLPNIGVGK